MIEVKYPGKLFILGEYAIMKEGNNAIIAAVNRYLSAKIEASKTLEIISDFGNLREDNFEISDLIYVKEAYNVAKDYLELKDIDIKTFKMVIESELNAKENLKYGFGSSGVVVVAVIDAILKFHEIELDKLSLFKLAVVSQYRMGKLSSGGDLASAIYGKIIHYRRYNLDNVSKDVKSVLKPWTNLEINYIGLDEDIHVGFTNKSHETNDALIKLKEFSKQDNYATFIEKGNQIVLDFLSDKDIAKAINNYRTWMLDLENNLNYKIEIKRLSDLIDSAKELGLSAKISGSGGGDCGIAIGQVDQDVLKSKWSELGIEYIEEAIK